MFEHAWRYLTELNAVRTISLDNSLVHQGKGFAHHSMHSVTNGSTLDHLIITPTDKDIHMRSWSVKSSVGPVSINVYEDCVVSANGSAEPVGNNNRQSSTANLLQLYTTPTVTSVGNLMLTDFIGATGTGAHVIVGESAADDTEWLLKKGSKYLFRIVNSAGSTASVVHTFNWFEI
jgi:hypothetical protein